MRQNLLLYTTEDDSKASYLVLFRDVQMFMHAG